MAAWTHYIITEDKKIDLEDIQRALQEISPDFYVDADLVVLKNIDPDKDAEEDELPVGQVTIDIFDDPAEMEDREWFEEWAEKKQEPDRVRKALERAKCQVTIQLINWHLWADNEYERTLEPLMDWLIANYEGLLYVEGGDFYDQQGILA